jgi:hypothetical protein
MTKVKALLPVVAVVALVLAGVGMGVEESAGAAAVYFTALLLAVLVTAVLVQLLNERAVEDRDDAWMAALGDRERELRDMAAAIEPGNVEQAVQYERRANAVQQAHYAARDRVRRGGR